MLFRLLRYLPLVTLTWTFWLYLSPQITLRSPSTTTADTAVTTTAMVTPLVVTPDAPAPPLNDPSLESNRLEIDLSDRKVTVYQDNAAIARYPIAIGRRGWETPEGQFRVLQMRRNPTWINPLTDESILGGDPENPLGTLWIGFWTNGRDWIGMHGTPERQSVGQAASHGCIRLLNEDIEKLYDQANLGRQVIVRQ